MEKIYILICMAFAFVGCGANTSENIEKPVAQEDLTYELEFPDSIIVEGNCEDGDESTEAEEPPLTDYGEPFPIDINKEAAYRYGELERKIAKREILGTWIMYGHLYDPRTILTLNGDGTYKWILQDYIGSAPKPSPEDYQTSDVRQGRYTYSPEYNKITLLKFHKKSDLDEADFVKYAEPTNHEMVVYYADGENMDIYEDTDMWYYQRVK